MRHFVFFTGWVLMRKTTIKLFGDLNNLSLSLCVFPVDRAAPRVARVEEGDVVADGAHGVEVGHGARAAGVAPGGGGSGRAGTRREGGKGLYYHLQASTGNFTIAGILEGLEFFIDESS